ncbi:MAG: outer membrane protein assembly factor BamD [Pseudomonadota bacterium]|nr:MAG: outer membrane protein assembly factor BamD [Pseudomonadota bacterium]
MLRLAVLLLTLLIAVAGCSSAKEKDDATVGMSAEEIYRYAKSELDAKQYESAIEYYSRLESKFPYGPYAQQAQLEIAYAYYRFDQFSSAIVAADRFIKLNPRHPSVDYAYYIRGLASHDVAGSMMQRIFRQDPTQRDPKSAREAFENFSELVRRFPESRYVPDSLKRMFQLREMLATHEMHVARYYYERGAYVAAANRAKHLVTDFQKTGQIAEALALMIQSYRQLALDDLAADALQVLELNYPDYARLDRLKQGEN